MHISNPDCAEMVAVALRQVLDLNELLEASEIRYAEAQANASAVIAQQAMENTALVAENARLRAELDAHGDARVNTAGALPAEDTY